MSKASHEALVRNALRMIEKVFSDKSVCKLKRAASLRRIIEAAEGFLGGL